MCGICGVVQTKGQVDQEVLRRMRDVLTHRGSDDAGLYVNGQVGLGHRRLSIMTGHFQGRTITALMWGLMNLVLWHRAYGQ